VARRTSTVIYPDQRHNITLPSYRVDRLQRYLARYEKYLRASDTTEGQTVSRVAP
jgi:hypothetical protein